MNTLHTFIAYFQFVHTSITANLEQATRDPLGTFKNSDIEGVIGESSDDYDLTNKDSFSHEFLQDSLEDIQLIGGILAIGAIVFSGFMFLVPASEETKKTGKMALIYSCIGFFAVVIAPYLINLIINIFYSLF